MLKIKTHQHVIFILPVAPVEISSPRMAHDPIDAYHKSVGGFMMSQEINDKVNKLLEAMVDAKIRTQDWADESVDLRRQFLALGKDAVPPLVAALDEPDENIRRQAVRALSIFKGDGVDGLIAALDNLAEHVRGLAATSLGEIGDPRALGPLKKRLEVERDAGTRRRIQTAIAALGDS
jgi:HEAT repeat protein